MNLGTGLCEEWFASWDHRGEMKVASHTQCPFYIFKIREKENVKSGCLSGLDPEVSFRMRVLRGTEVVGLEGRLLWVTRKSVIWENEWWLGRAGRIGETLGGRTI